MTSAKLPGRGSPWFARPARAHRRPAPTLMPTAPTDPPADPERTDAPDQSDQTDETGLADAARGDEVLVPGQRLLRSFRPEGTLQIVVAVLAVCFLAGAIGYSLGGTLGRTPSNAADEGFLVDMSDHHDQAIRMALCAVDRATDTTVRHFAAEVLVFQSVDLGLMGAWLADRNLTRPGGLDRPAMAWMDMSVRAETMPGMATEEQLTALCKVTGPEVDRLFLQLMREHHRGGVHMAEAAAARVADPKLREFAAKMATNQAVEVNEYTATLKRLGYE